MIRVSAAIGYERPLIEASIELDGKYIILGPNGSGKTTLFRGIAGIARIFSGNIEVIGGLAVNLYEALLLVPRLAAGELIELRSDLYRVDKSAILEIFLDQLSFPRELLKREVTKLSSGERKSVLNSIALGSGKENILLDEPFEGLDPARKARLIKIIDKASGTIVINTHETTILEALEDRKVFLMFYGRLYGPYRVKELLSAGIVEGKAENAIVTIELENKTISLVPNAGRSLTSIYSLDQLYLL